MDNTQRRKIHDLIIGDNNTFAVVESPDFGGGTFNQNAQLTLVAFTEVQQLEAFMHKNSEKGSARFSSDEKVKSISYFSEVRKCLANKANSRFERCRKELVDDAKKIIGESAKHRAIKSQNFEITDIFATIRKVR